MPPTSEPPYLDGDGIDVFETLSRGVVVRDELLLECHPPLKRDGKGGGGEAGGESGKGGGGGGGAGGGERGGGDGGSEGEDGGLLDGEAWRQRGYRWEGVAGAAAADALPVHGHALIVGGWKLLQLGQVAPAEEAGWHAPPGQDTRETRYTLGCDLSQQPTAAAASECVGAPCLFDVASDPCEYRDLATARPEMVAKLTARLAQLQATAVPPAAPHGCLPVIVGGAWRPCDAPSPFGPSGSAGQPIELVA